MPVGRKEGKPLLRMLTGGPGNPADIPPIWLMRQAGRYLPEYRALRAQSPSFLDFCFTPDLAVEATLQPIRRFGFDGAIMFSDILVIPHALGQAVRFAEGHGPLLEPLRSTADIDAAVGRGSSRSPGAGLRDPAAPLGSLAGGDDADRLRRRALDRRELHDRGGGRQRFRQCQAHGLWRARALRRADRSSGGEHRRLPRWPDRGRGGGAAALRQLVGRPGGARAAALVAGALGPDHAAFEGASSRRFR